MFDLNFFENGILIIVGDHRAMIPLKKNEIEAFGSLKPKAKVPLVISFGNKKHALDRRQYQQIDVCNTLKGLVSRTQCHSDWIGNIFSKNPAKFIAHRRGDKRNLISIFTDENTATVILDGDDTRITSVYPENMKIRTSIINEINSIRINASTKEMPNQS